jgi:hypothetical protein
MKVHFNKYHPKYDLWVELTDRERVAEIGKYSKAYVLESVALGNVWMVLGDNVVRKNNKYETAAVSAADDVEGFYQSAKATVEDLMKGQI